MLSSLGVLKVAVVAVEEIKAVDGCPLAGGIASITSSGVYSVACVHSGSELEKESGFHLFQYQEEYCVERSQGKTN